MFGILNVNKPAGWTSRDVVNRVARLVQPAKAGHAGTLDPLATGVLVVCIGPATKLIEAVQQMPKQYRATFQLGCHSVSDDTEEEVCPLDSPPIPTQEQIQATLPHFHGEIPQRPPAYSAINVNGRKAYRLARQGELLELPPRPVSIYSLEMVRYDYPELVLDVRCGSGTYIRSLGRDLAHQWGTAAVMSGLVRTAIGEFRHQVAVSPIELTTEQLERHLLPPVLAVATMPHIELSPEEVTEIRYGRFLYRQLAEEKLAAGIDPQGELVALMRSRGQGIWGPKNVFPPR